MKWFDKWFAKKCKQVMQEPEQSFSPISKNSIKLTTSSGYSEARRIQREGMNFTVYPASNGGFVLEFRLYDEKLDRSTHNLHIIAEDQNLSEGIAHIITVEMLRH